MLGHSPENVNKKLWRLYGAGAFDQEDIFLHQFLFWHSDRKGVILIPIRTLAARVQWSVKKTRGRLQRLVKNEIIQKRKNELLILAKRSNVSSPSSNDLPL